MSKTTELSPVQLRHAIRSGEHVGNTSGFCQGFVQCNLVILPADAAADFLKFCEANPKPCPLIAMSEPGASNIPKLGTDLDIRKWHSHPRD